MNLNCYPNFVALLTGLNPGQKHEANQVHGNCFPHRSLALGYLQANKYN
jgi:hypothetical protein